MKRRRRRQKGRGLFTPTGIVPRRGVIPRRSSMQRGFGSIHGVIHDIILAKTRKKWRKLAAQKGGFFEGIKNFARKIYRNRKAVGRELLSSGKKLRGEISKKE